MTEYAPVLGVLAGILGVADTVPYLRDTLRRSTVPHRGTWLIWSVLEVVVAAAQFADEARWSLVPLVVQAIVTSLVFALSVPYGTGGLSRVELALTGVAGAGVVGWLVADEPVVATACVIAADLVAAVLMLPKAWRHPGSETLSTYVLAGLGGVAMVGAVGSASPALLAYPVYFALVNGGLAVVIGLRRRRLAAAGPAVPYPAGPAARRPVA